MHTYYNFLLKNLFIELVNLIVIVALIFFLTENFVDILTMVYSILFTLTRLITIFSLLRINDYNYEYISIFYRIFNFISISLNLTYIFLESIKLYFELNYAYVVLLAIVFLSTIGCFIQHKIFDSWISYKTQILIN